jgi:hypothetical protein
MQQMGADGSSISAPRSGDGEQRIASNSGETQLRFDACMHGVVCVGCHASDSLE